MFQLRGAFGNFASPDNPFFNGKVAMIMQGVWMNNFIKNYAPSDFEYGAAAFPEETEHPGAPMTSAETDILVIPTGQLCIESFLLASQHGQPSFIGRHTSEKNKIHIGGHIVGVLFEGRKGKSRRSPRAVG